MSYQQNYEKELGRRNDKNEHISALYQPDKIVFKFNNIELEGLAGPVEIRNSEDERTYMLCMTAITDRFMNEGGGRQRFDPRLASLGENGIVIANVAEFVRRLADAVVREQVYRYHLEGAGRLCDLVEYVDFSSHHGEVGPFRKGIEYRFQHEWRAVISIRSDLPLPLPDSIFLDLGDLSDITTVIPREAFVEGEVVVEPRPGATPR